MIKRFFTSQFLVDFSHPPHKFTYHDYSWSKVKCKTAIKSEVQFEYSPLFKNYRFVSDTPYSPFTVFTTHTLTPIEEAGDAALFVLCLSERRFVQAKPVCN